MAHRRELPRRDPVHRRSPLQALASLQSSLVRVQAHLPQHRALLLPARMLMCAIAASLPMRATATVRLSVTMVWWPFIL